jgi:TPR repeat protein
MRAALISDIHGNAIALLGASGPWWRGAYPKNLPRAVELYGRGCDLGFATSCSELAGMLRAGKEVSRDSAHAASLDRQACKLGRKASCAK